MCWSAIEQHLYPTPMIPPDAKCYSSEICQLTAILFVYRVQSLAAMNKKNIQIDHFNFEISVDPTTDPLSAIEVMVYFRDEPCCDGNGHQYRFYLPVGLSESSLKDLCEAFTKAVHCEHHAMVA